MGSCGSKHHESRVLEDSLHYMKKKSHPPVDKGGKGMSSYKPRQDHPLTETYMEKNMGAPEAAKTEQLSDVSQ